MAPRKSTRKPDIAATAQLLPPDLAKQEFGQRLYKALLDKNWSQSDLARAVDTGRDSVSKYVRGLQMPEPPMQEKIAKALGLHPEDLFPRFQGAPTEVHGLEIKRLTGRPGLSWVRFNQVMTNGGAAKLIALVDADEEAVRKMEKD